MKRLLEVVIALLRYIAQDRRRVILAVATVLYVLSVLYAPWSARASVQAISIAVDHGVARVQYGPIFYPPHCSGDEWLCHYMLDVPRLLIEWIFIAIMGSMAWLWK